jgi:uncharacterized membrane protein YbhN (UPF0104 family)
VLNTLKRNGWWLAITLAGVLQDGAIAAGVGALVVGTLLRAARAVWLSLSQRLRDRHHRHELASSRARIQLSKRPAKNQGHRHAYP